MLEKAKEKRAIHDWVDMNKWVRDENISHARELPYFEGDYWPGIIEETVKELNAEESGPDAKGGKGKKGSKKGAAKSKSKNKSGAKGGGKKGKQSLAQGEEELADRLFQTLEKHKDTFFVAYLLPPDTQQEKIKDHDTDMLCELMDGRDGLLSLCRDGHHEFSELRRAKHSSMVVLYNLHVQESGDFNYTCNNCEGLIGAMDYRCVDSNFAVVIVDERLI